MKKIINKCNGICNVPTSKLISILWGRFTKVLKENGKAAAYAIHH